MNYDISDPIPITSQNVSAGQICVETRQHCPQEIAGGLLFTQS